MALQVDLGELAAGWFFDPTVQWGTASSPVIHDGKVIVQADVFGGAFIAAIDITDGHELWRTTRDEISSWATPTVVATPERTEVVTNGGRAIRSYRPLCMTPGLRSWPVQVRHAIPEMSGGEVHVPVRAGQGGVPHANGSTPSTLPARRKTSRPG